MPPSAHFLLAFALAATLALPASAAVLGEGGCACSDVRPRVGSGATHVERFAVGKTCAEIRDAGDCSAEWMTDTVKELSGDGYCMVIQSKGEERGVCGAPVATTLFRAGASPTKHSPHHLSSRSRVGNAPAAPPSPPPCARRASPASWTPPRAPPTRKPLPTQPGWAPSSRRRRRRVPSHPRISTPTSCRLCRNGAMPRGR